ncbi:hypothetical protein MC885_016066 [Smutsia gigantea]|nr:hypothetical protein MC885_016066 [Smutsia gigantea]
MQRKQENLEMVELQVIRFQVFQLHVSGSTMKASQKDFENSVNQVKLWKKKPGNEVKLKLYALYKQETARQNYVDMVSSLSSSSESSSQIKPGANGEQPGYETLVVTSQDGITKIMLNRPTKKNAISTQMYQEIMLALKAASTDDSSITVLTGKMFSWIF